MWKPRGAIAPIVTAALEPFAPLSRQLTDRWRALAGSRAGPVVCFVWAVGEATVWPVIPDVALFVLLLAAPHRLRVLLPATIAGALVGGSITVAITALAPHAALAVVQHVPLVHQQSVATVNRDLSTMPLLQAFLLQPWSGIPFKLWAVLAVIAGKSPAAVIPCFVLGRALRFAAAALIGAALGRLLRPRLRTIAVPLILVFGPAGAYVFYAIAIAG